MRKLMERYFPKSLKEYEMKAHKPANVLDVYEPLKCICCGKDLLEKDIQGKNIIAFVRKYDKQGISYIKDIYWSCKGECDEKAEMLYRSRGFSTPWENIRDIIIPSKYISWICAILNNMKDNKTIYSDEAFEKLKQFIILSSQMVLREVSEEKKERARHLAMIENLMF